MTTPDRLDLDHYTDESNAWHIYGLTLTTHRLFHPTDGSIEFPYQAVAAAVAVAFCRTTVYSTHEPWAIRYVFAALLAALAYARKSYELILAVQVFSYSFVVLQQVLLLPALQRQPTSSISSSTGTTTTWAQRLLYGTVGLLSAAALSYGFAHSVVTGLFLETLQLVTPQFIIRGFFYLIPVQECTDAYHMLQSLALPVGVLDNQLSHLLFVTFNIQTGMGFLGINFLKEEQQRRNMLIRMDVASDDDVTPEEEAKAVAETKSVSNANGTADGEESTKEEQAEAKIIAAKMMRSRRFQRTALPFIFRAALPYMFQIIFYGNLNAFCFKCLHHDLHRTIRWHQPLSYDSHWMAMTQTPVSPEVYATSIDNVANTVYDLFNRKLFSLPKILLLPGVMSRQPWLVVQVFPFIMISDWLKASAVAYLTKKIEHLQEEVQKWQAIRTKVESFDIKNAELLHRSGAQSLPYTQRRWEALTNQVQNRLVVMELLQRSKRFFAFIERNFVFSVLVDCALANLIAVGKIVSAEIFVFSRAMEDAVDLLLMRSRSEAELARMITDLERLAEVRDLWQSQEASTALLRCTIATPTCEDPAVAHRTPKIVLRNLHYSRGTAQVRADHVELTAGVYALTGGNGSGKSTLFRVLMSCRSNQKPIELPPSIHLLTPMEPIIEEDDLLREKYCEADDDQDEDEIDDKPAQVHVPHLSIAMPSERVVEISQNFYWPLYARPMDWIIQGHSSLQDTSAAQRMVAEWLHSLEFFRPVIPKGIEDPSEDEIRESTIDLIIQELTEEKEDWFSDLSGGQKSKAELVRQVFLYETCPDVLLVDETMAPLDPASKSLVMKALKSFCSESVVIVIYHMDVQTVQEDEDDAALTAKECIPSTNFFDHNIHLEHGILHLRDVC